LEGNIVSLNSVLRNRCLSRVTIRRLRKQNVDNKLTTVMHWEEGKFVPSGGSNNVYAYLKMEKDLDDPIRQVNNQMIPSNH
jgi:hypothetical protein